MNPPRQERPIPMEPRETTNLATSTGTTRCRGAARSEALAAGTPSPATTVFLGTVRPDGRPHAAGVGAAWIDGVMYFVSGPGTRKSRNLEANPACTLSARLPGLDLVLEGEATRVTDAETLESVAARYRERAGPRRSTATRFTAPYSAPSAGPPPWHLYRVAIHTAFGVGRRQSRYGATRWRF